ncbi:amino acid permease [Thermobrachium celere]|uniref:Amino acid permease family protein n=1 Tax=Thermobrachium celere DSM 8682 TaxID=941824 RepID=R7RUN0_9CLOT|nr:amino acid permease [Thermobrachium celere]CDF59153.1 amino acid permease family protein [Thermobrachium celere DSM 8682]
MSNSKKLGLWTLVMLTFVPTFGFGNITSNAVVLGPAAIPSWFIVSVLFFFPLSIMIAEISSANQDKEGGLYAWIESSLGPKWAFIGTWSYFIANLFYLQMVFARIPVSTSWALFGENRFTDQNAYLLPYLSVVLAILLTFIATRGVKRFAKLSDFGGKFTLAATVIFIVFAIVGYLTGTPSATQFTAENTIPKFDVSYFATFSWLLFAVAGAEVAGTYIKEVDNPEKTFPKAVIIATIFIALAYIIGSVAVCLVASPEVLESANLKDAGYIVYKILAENWGINGKIVVQLYAFIFTITSIAAYIVWIESPIRAMFAEVPEGTFPRFLTAKSEDGTLKNALWVQCAIVIILILVPLLGIESIDAFFKLLYDLSALSLVVPYIILIVAYISFRKKNMDAPFKFFKTNSSAMVFSWIALILSVAGFIGAGFDYVLGSESTSEAIKLVFKTYGGPIILILFGYLIAFGGKKNIASKSQDQSI